VTKAAHCAHISDHQREWLRIAAFALTQVGDGGRVARVHQKLKSADALERDDLATSERGRGIGNGKIDIQAAVRAGDGLRMKPPVVRILILRAAGGAQRKARSHTAWLRC
jgi:hypothetical protein